MARGFKTGGRKKGAKNKRTLLLENSTHQMLDRATELLGDNAFEGDAHALLTSIYKNTRLPLEFRLHAAKAAIRFEKPPLSPVDAKGNVDNVHYIISDRPSLLRNGQKSITLRLSL
jgi:hypothetical protein